MAALVTARRVRMGPPSSRSEEHTSELQSLTNLVCRLLLEKKKTNKFKLELSLCEHSDSLRVLQPEISGDLMCYATVASTQRYPHRSSYMDCAFAMSCAVYD